MTKMNWEKIRRERAVAKQDLPLTGDRSSGQRLAAPQKSRSGSQLKRHRINRGGRVSGNTKPSRFDLSSIPEGFHVIYVDAGVENNGGYGGRQRARICIHDGKQTAALLDEEIGDHTNNEAEILVILRALDVVVPPGVILSDSQLAVNMVTGKWKGKAPNLRAIVKNVKIPERVSIAWIPRDQNEAGFYLENLYGL